MDVGAIGQARHPQGAGLAGRLGPGGAVLVSRGPVEGNRRAVAVELTEAGRAFLAKSHAEIDGLLEECLAGLAKGELDELAAAAETSANLLVKALC